MAVALQKLVATFYRITLSGPYPGWSVFCSEIKNILKELITKLKAPQISRIGLRYINILRPKEHHIHGLADTNVIFRLGDENLTDSLNVNFTRTFGPNHTVAVKVATPDLVVGSVQPGFSLLCDIDVGTKIGTAMTDYEDMMAWIEAAHTLEKAEFFAILPDRIIDKIHAESGGKNNG